MTENGNAGIKMTTPLTRSQVLELVERSAGKPWMDLRPGEIIEEGDQWFCVFDGWVETTSIGAMIGGVYTRDENDKPIQYRRPVNPSLISTVQVLMEEKEELVKELRLWWQDIKSKRCFEVRSHNSSDVAIAKHMTDTLTRVDALLSRLAPSEVKSER